MKFKLIGTSQEHPGTCLNISGAGLSFSSQHAIQLGKCLEIRVEPDRRLMPPIRAFVEVTRCQAINSHQYQLATSIKGIKAN
ncbi:MAG: PilZ domain-containing protein [Methylococcales bacterium]|nr:PilZ domain-containing protein [Methylococcales bacterium]